MTLNNIKTLKKDKGFTLVELLIVIVVIAILATIVIVAYNGVQGRAKTTSAQASATTLQKKLEAYNANKGNYPVAASATTSLNDTTIPEANLTGSGISIGTPDSTNGQKTVQVKICSAPAAATGYQLTYYDFVANSLPGSPQITGGTNGTACTTWTTAS